MPSSLKNFWQASHLLVILRQRKIYLFVINICINGEKLARGRLDKKTH